MYFLGGGVVICNYFDIQRYMFPYLDNWGHESFPLPSHIEFTSSVFSHKVDLVWIWNCEGGHLEHYLTMLDGKMPTLSYSDDLDDRIRCDESLWIAQVADALSKWGSPLQFPVNWKYVSKHLGKYQDRFRTLTTQGS